MRIFKLIGMTLLMVVLAVNFTACSNDDDEKGEDNTLSLLVGSWEMTETWETTHSQYNPATGKYETVTETVIYNTIFTFNSDKTYSRYKDGKNEETVIGTYKYYPDIKKIVLTSDDGSYSVVLLEVSSDKLIIDNDGDVEEYTRKK